VTRPALRARFSSAEPFPHLVLDDFLAPAFARALAAEFPDYDAARFRDRFGRPAKASYPELSALGPAFRRLDALTVGRPFLARLESLTGIPRLLHARDRYRGAAHEYLPGMGLCPHLDFNVLPGSGWHRRLNAVLFLNEGRRGAGGEVVLGSRARGQAEKVVAPAFNRLLIFSAGEWSWHRLDPAPAAGAQRRLSVSLFFYAASPPPDAAPPRLTLWDFPPLPRRARAGIRLDDRLWPDVEEPFILRDLELSRGAPPGRAFRRSPLSGRLKRGAVLTRADAAWLRRALERRDRALEREWRYPDRFLDDAVARLSRRRAT
jgi:hypothetical protein